MVNLNRISKVIDLLTEIASGEKEILENKHLLIKKDLLVYHKHIGVCNSLEEKINTVTENMSQEKRDFNTQRTFLEKKINNQRKE